MESSSSPPPAAAATSTAASGGGSSEQGKLFVGGIAFDTTEEALRKYFGKYGEVAQANIMRERATGNARGFAFVSFSDPSSADRAIQDSTAKHVILGRTVEVKRAIPRGEQHQNQQYSNCNQHQNRGLSKSNSKSTDSIQTRNKKIFVGGLSSNLTEDEFRSYFEKFGKITDVVVMYDSTTHRPRGFGFITFDLEESVEKAVQMSFHELNGKTVEVKRAVPKEGNNSNSNNNNSNNYSSMNGYNSRVANGRGSPFSNYQGGLYPYSPRYGFFQGFEPQPVLGYGYGVGGYPGGYTIGGYGGLGYGVPYAGLRIPWNGSAYVGARRSPYNTAWYPGYLNGSNGPYSGMASGGYHNLDTSANRKSNQNGNVAVNGATPLQVEGGKLKDR